MSNGLLTEFISSNAELGISPAADYIIITIIIIFLIAVILRKIYVKNHRSQTGGVK